MRRVLLFSLSLILQGCLGPPNTFGDMWERVDGMRVPAEFSLVGKQQMGLRTRAGSPPRPTASNYYSASWDEGALCERLRGILEIYGKPEATRSGTCGYEIAIGSGWKARFVNVWAYRVEAFAADPDAVARLMQGHDCPEVRKRHDEEIGQTYHSRYVPCWVNPGEALVTITLHGKEGW